MSEAAKMRMERITRLIHELEYEIIRGVMEHEIEPDIHFSKVFPCTGRGDNLARIDLHVSPARTYDTAAQGKRMPRLRVVSDDPA
jgi:hypothetical protein